VAIQTEPIKKYSKGLGGESMETETRRDQTLPRRASHWRYGLAGEEGLETLVRLRRCYE
jgi:hypothetical protein